MRVAVVGAGAMGVLAAHILGAAGMEVVLYETREGRLHDLASRGLVLRGVLEGESRPEVRHPSEGGGPFDVFLLAVKAHATADALRPLSPFVHRETFYVSLQEGNAGEELAELVGRERAWAALAWVSAAEAADGVVEVEGCRALALGPTSPRRADEEPPGLAAVEGALRGGFPGRVARARDLRREIFVRLLSAAPVSGMCALLGEVPCVLRGDGEVEAWLREAAQEIAGTAATLGMELPLPRDPWDDAVWDRLPPPMLRDALAGGMMERVNTTGFLLAESARAGIRTPVLSAVHSLLAEVERGDRRPGRGVRRELRRRISEERGMPLM